MQRFVKPDARRSGADGQAASRARPPSPRARRRAPARWMSPHSAASAPETSRPSSRSSLARAKPTRRGISHVAPLSGLNPRCEERLPEPARGRRDGEVGGERELATETRRPAAHRAHHRQLDLDEQLDEAVGLQRRAPLELPARGRGPPAVLLATQSAPAQKSAPLLRSTDGSQRVVERSLLERVDDRARPRRGGARSSARAGRGGCAAPRPRCRCRRHRCSRALMRSATSAPTARRCRAGVVGGGAEGCSSTHARLRK